MVEFITMAPTSGDSTLVGLANNSSKLNSWTGTDENAERPLPKNILKRLPRLLKKADSRRFYCRLAQDALIL